MQGRLKILDKADSNANGRVQLKDFMSILKQMGLRWERSERIHKNKQLKYDLFIRAIQETILFKSWQMIL
jgi:hypothetical protein